MCTTTKYLGYIINNEMSDDDDDDDDDMYRQCFICSSKYVGEKILYMFRSDHERPF